MSSNYNATLLSRMIQQFDPSLTESLHQIFAGHGSFDLSALDAIFDVASGTEGGLDGVIKRSAQSETGVNNLRKHPEMLFQFFDSAYKQIQETRDTTPAYRRLPPNGYIIHSLISALAYGTAVCGYCGIAITSGTISSTDQFVSYLQTLLDSMTRAIPGLADLVEELLHGRRENADPMDIWTSPLVTSGLSSFFTTVPIVNQGVSSRLLMDMYVDTCAIANMLLRPPENSMSTWTATFSPGTLAFPYNQWYTYDSGVATKQVVSEGMNKYMCNSTMSSFVRLATPGSKISYDYNNNYQVVGACSNLVIPQILTSHSNSYNYKITPVGGTAMNLLMYHSDGTSLEGYSFLICDPDALVSTSTSDIAPTDQRDVTITAKIQTVSSSETDIVDLYAIPLSAPTSASPISNWTVSPSISFMGKNPNYRIAPSTVPCSVNTVYGTSEDADSTWYQFDVSVTITVTAGMNAGVILFMNVSTDGKFTTPVIDSSAVYTRVVNPLSVAKPIFTKLVGGAYAPADGTPLYAQIAQLPTNALVTTTGNTIYGILEETRSAHPYGLAALICFLTKYCGMQYTDSIVKLCKYILGMSPSLRERVFRLLMEGGPTVMGTPECLELLKT